jgi:hypothetical protein
MGLGFTSSTATIERPLMTSKLKAADPTIVEGPREDGMASISDTVPITLSKISGADEPKAINVRFATVAFQTGISYYSFFLVSSSMNVTIFTSEVITSIASINMSDIIAIPTNKYTKDMRYMNAKNPPFNMYMPGTSTQLYKLKKLERYIF